MKKKTAFVLVLLALLFVASGCEQGLPNPIVGSYVKYPPNSEHDFIAAISLRNDGTFSYFQSSEDGRDYAVYEGKYTIVLRSYTFLEADGNIIFSFQVDDGPSHSDPLIFKWKCDKDKGPKNLNLIRDPDDQNQNLEFTSYYGPENALDEFFDDATGRPHKGDGDGSEGGGTEGEGGEPAPEAPEDGGEEAGK